MALVTCPCAFRLRRLVQSGCRAPGARHFPVNSRILSRVHVHSGCTGSHKVVVAFLRRGICPILAEHGSYEMSMCISTVWMAVKIALVSRLCAFGLRRLAQRLHRGVHKLWVRGIFILSSRINGLLWRSC